MNGFTCTTNVYNLICVHTCLSGKLNNSSSSHHCSLTRHAKTTLKDDFQSVALCEFNGVRIYIDSHEKQSHII